MTRKEQIKEVAQKEMSKYPNFCITAPAFRMGAEWADKTMVDKACRWLENYLKPLPHELDEFINERNLIIERFRKAMEL